MTSDRNQDARARGTRIAARWLVIGLLALAAAGCATGGAGSAGYGAPAASAAAASATGEAITAQATSLAVILVDGAGRTVYGFANDTNGTSATMTCAAICARSPGDPARIGSRHAGPAGEVGAGPAR